MSKPATRWLLPVGTPRKGWISEGCFDLGRLPEDMEACQACGTMHRYSHRLTHPDAGARLYVGIQCAGRLTENYVRVKAREAAARLADPLRAYRKTAAGNYLRDLEGIAILLWRSARDGRWRLKVGDEFQNECAFASAELAARYVHEQATEARLESALMS